jgi:hypothetical protein
MTTERLIVLAGAAALGEFTAPELAAYTGANAGTVRQVLQREQKRHGFFERIDPRTKPSNGRPAVLWRLSDDCRDQVLNEIASEEEQIAELRDRAGGSLSRARSTAERAERAEMFVASAEEMVTRSYDTDDRGERAACATIALNLLLAANPSESEVPPGRQVKVAEWWNQERVKPREEFTASLDAISRVSIESQLRSVHRSRQILEQEEPLRRRAYRVAAFAALSARLAEGQPIGPEDLKDAAESISAGSGILPVPQTLGWIKVFVDVSIASGNPAPVAILAKSGQSPDEFFSIARGAWNRVHPPTELAVRGYSLWVESWAETLLAYSLIPGIVVAHDDSPESNETLTEVMRATESSGLGRAVVVASTTDDVQVAGRISQGGGTFFSIRRTVETLLAAVNSAVIRSVSATPALGISYLMAGNTYAPEMDTRAWNDSAINFYEAVSGVAVRSDALELAQRTLAVFGDAVREFDTVTPEPERHAAGPENTDIYADLARRIAERLNGLGDSRHALSIAEEALGNYRWIVRFKLLPSSTRRGFQSSRHRLAEIEQRREVEDDMAWAYDNLSDLSHRSDQDDLTEEPGRRV